VVVVVVLVVVVVKIISVPLSSYVFSTVTCSSIVTPGVHRPSTSGKQVSALEDKETSSNNKQSLKE